LEAMAMMNLDPASRSCAGVYHTPAHEGSRTGAILIFVRITHVQTFRLS
jgi:hypothetical protein